MISRLGLAALCVLAFSACTPKNDDPLAQPSDAHKTPSGLASKVLRVGLGSTHPTPRSTVTVYYTGWTPDGRVFDSDVAPQEPLSFPLDHVIQGWTEGLQLMVKGEKRRFWIPGSLGYDNLDVPGAPKGTLIFDIELLEIR
jgi:FKBP-type peptidyl-prolyl cis-trans isomerase